MLVEVFIDGASRGQGQTKENGEAACAVVVYRNRKKIAQFARPLGRRTNNEAEYEALISALLICAMSEAIEDPIIYSDSALVVNQVKGEWQCKNENMFPLLFAVKTIQEDYRFRLVQVPRSFVHEADTLVNECLNKLQEERAKKKMVKKGNTTS